MLLAGLCAALIQVTIAHPTSECLATDIFDERGNTKDFSCPSHVILKGEKIEDAHIKGFMDALSKHEDHQDVPNTITLSANSFGEAGMKAIARYLHEVSRDSWARSKRSGLRHLRIQHPKGDPVQLARGFAAVVTALQSPAATLWELQVHGVHIDLGVAQAIEGMLRANNILQELGLDSCQMDCEVTSVIARGLRDNRGIEVLSMSHNRIGDAGTSAIAAALSLSSSRVHSLNLPSNQMHWPGLHALGRMLEVNTRITLCVIKPHHHGLEESDIASILVPALEKNRALRDGLPVACILGDSRISNIGWGTFELTRHVRWEAHNGGDPCPARVEVVSWSVSLLHDTGWLNVMGWLAACVLAVVGIFSWRAYVHAQRHKMFLPKYT